MYLGFYTSTVTNKNQLTFPKKLGSGGKYIITAWFENSIIVLPQEKGMELLSQQIEVSNLLPEGRDLSRFFYGNAQEIVLDIKNRFVLPAHLKEYAKIGSEVVFLGIGERIEIWDKKFYENYGKIREAQIRETAITHYNRISKNK